jgi:DNA-binding protein H-NS
MTSPDLSNLSYPELLKLSEELNQKIEAQRVEELKVIADGYVKKAQACGFSVEEAIRALQPYATDAKTRAKRRSPGLAIPLYQDPANLANTWSGRGLPARWLADYEAQGRSRDEFKRR